MPETDLFQRTAKFASFLKSVANLKTKPVAEVQQYLSVRWFHSMPREQKELLSPLLGTPVGEDDVRWLVASRPKEPSFPEPPEQCQVWLEGVELRQPGAEPQIRERRQTTGENGETIEEPLPQSVLTLWLRYLVDEWMPWATRQVVFLRLKAEYEHLFTMHNRLAERPEALELFIGVGLLSSCTSDFDPYRRHLVAFPAEMTFDSVSGRLTVLPSAEFSGARLELDFLPPRHRTLMQPQTGPSADALAVVGASVHDEAALAPVIRALVHAVDANSKYSVEFEPPKARAGETVAAFAPALILRERGKRAFVDLVAKIERDAAKGALTTPWRQLMEDSRAHGESGGDDAGSRFEGRIYFPLPTNDEQRRIVGKVSNSAGVLVEGPPGTGKSHTIANLISHYLATGQRVLVTAETAQALKALRQHIPQPLAELCISLLGSGNDADKELERSVRAILGQLNDHRGAAEREAAARAIEARLDAAERDLQRMERLLVGLRVAEADVSEPVPGYRATRMKLAERIATERERLGWIPDQLPVDAEGPEVPSEIARLSDYVSNLQPSERVRFARQWFPVPFQQDQSEKAVAGLVAAREAEAGFGAEDPLTKSLPSLPPEQVDRLAAWLSDVGALRRRQVPDDISLYDSMLAGLCSNASAKWSAIEAEFDAAMRVLTDEVAGSWAEVDAGGRPRAEAAASVKALHAHYANGGRRRLVFVKPTVVKQHDWVEQAVRVSGEPVVSPAQVERCARALQAIEAFERAERILDAFPYAPSAVARVRLSALRGRAALLKGLLALQPGAAGLGDEAQAWLAKAVEDATPLDQLVRAVAHRRARLARAEAEGARDHLLNRFRRCESPRQEMALPLTHLKDALLKESLEDLQAAWEEIRDEETARSRFAAYEGFLSAVRRMAPQAAAMIQQWEGSRVEAPRLDLLSDAWLHRRADSWLRDVLDVRRVASTEREVATLRGQVEDLVLEAATERAWAAALDPARLDVPTRQALIAWQDAVARMTRPGSKSYFQRRAAARGYLNRALEAVPAWVVSLPRLYETVDPRPGIFDLAVIDEASQCSLDALVIFYLSKRVIVVGDDKQISPTVIGVSDVQVSALANALLDVFQFRNSYTLESSLFSHARRSFTANTVVLREHFRCVPEIIRFSNQLCYDNKLVPLRRVEKARLEPLKACFVEGHREGDRNESEARSLVRRVLDCHRDDAYDGKTFGVITLQGHEQARLIETLLLREAGPDVFRERKLRCGEPYAFQGDERDVMFISMVAAPNANNGTLSADVKMYEQRFNVALSRARDQAWLFHSLTAEHVAPNCLRRRVLDFFLTPRADQVWGSPVDVEGLERLLLTVDKQFERPPKPFDSWFEVEMAVALARRGYPVSAQVPAGPYRIDLVIGHGGAQLAVECDGDACHGPEEFEADLARQRQLERAQWTFVRVRGSEFHYDREAALRRVDEAWKQLEVDEDGEDPSVLVTEATAPVLATPSPGSFEPVVRSADGDEDEHCESPTGLARDASPGPTDGDQRQLSFEEIGSVEARTEPFTGYRGKAFPDPRTATRRNVREAVRDIVQQDGPLPKSAVYSLYRDGCADVERVSKTLRTAVNRALADLQGMKVVVVEDEGAARRPEEVIVRMADCARVVVRRRGRRSLYDIPLRELGAVMREVSQGRAPSEGAERLFRAVLERFEFKSLTVAVADRLEQARKLEFS